MYYKNLAQEQIMLRLMEMEDSRITRDYEAFKRLARDMMNDRKHPSWDWIK